MRVHDIQNLGRHRPKHLHSLGVFLVAILALALLSSCDDGSATAKIGISCYDAKACGSAFCGPEQVCTVTCTTDADCASANGTYLCGTLADGSKACLGACDPNSYAYGDIACVDGRPIACAAAPDSACATCGCPSSLRCEAGVGCMPKNNVGGACTLDSDCSTDNCGQYTHVCNVPVGQACTSTNCELCITSSASPGWSFCSRECYGDSVCNGGRCIGNSSTDYYYCHPSCSSYYSTCDGGGTCNYPSNGTQLYCSCPNCTLTDEPRPLAAECDTNAQCASNTCFSVTPSCTYTSCDTIGLCSKSCTNDNDCGSGLRCATSCTGATCANRCLPTCNSYCSEGTCRTLKTGASGTASVCDVYVSDGGQCSSGTQCVSGICTAGACAPASGVVNGGKCSVPTDCASGSCVSGTCRGTALIGGACSGAYDCAVGSCCTYGTNVNHCETSC